MSLFVITSLLSSFYKLVVVVVVVVVVFLTCGVFSLEEQGSVAVELDRMY